MKKAVDIIGFKYNRNVYSQVTFQTVILFHQSSLAFTGKLLKLHCCNMICMTQLVIIAKSSCVSHWCLLCLPVQEECT